MGLIAAGKKKRKERENRIIFGLKNRKFRDYVLKGLTMPNWMGFQQLSIGLMGP